jgi:hypothetical protein
MTTFKQKIQRALALVGLSAVGSAAFAGGGGTDYSTLVAAVDFATVSTGVLGVAAALIVVYITIKGVKLMMGFTVCCWLVSRVVRTTISAIVTTGVSVVVVIRIRRFRLSVRLIRVLWRPIWQCQV